MATYSTNEFRGGLKVMLEGDPCSIIESEFVKPGKGQPFNRVKLRNLKTGRVWERTFKSGETVEAADVVETDMQYLYNDGDFWHFMSPETYEQYQADANVVGDGAKWIKEEQDLAEYAERQYRLLSSCAGLLAPGGRIVYSTCSTEREENEDVIRRFLHSHPGFAVAKTHESFPEGALRLLDERGMLRTFPERDAMDGYFAVALERSE